MAMASQFSNLFGWAKRVFVKPAAYEHVPENDVQDIGVAYVPEYITLSYVKRLMMSQAAFRNKAA
jgi:hypothetical protein